MIRRLVMIAALGLVAVLGVFWLRQRAAAPRQPPRSIELVDGTRLQGTLLTLRAESFVVQTDSQSLLLTRDEIRRIDGRVPDDLALVAGRKIAFAQETYEAVADSGFVEVRSSWRWRNDGAAILDRVDWGLGPHEVSQLQHYRVLDAYGNELPLQVEDDAKIGGKRVVATLRRPVLPGEEGRLTLLLRRFDALSAAGDTMVYRNAGDYPDDRLVTRCVSLPMGAHLLAVHPEPLYTGTAAGREFVVWRRFFKAGESVPWEIRFRPAVESP